MKQLIYKHTYNIDSYIGQTLTTMESRLKQHIYRANTGAEWSFQKALRVFGAENFTSEILEDNIPICSNLETKLTLADEREIYWIEYYDTFHNGLNETKGGGGGLGRITKPETRAKLSKIHKNKTVSEATKIKQKENHANFNGNKNPNAKTIKIYNNKDEVMFITNGNFKNVCEEFKLPFYALKESYKNNGLKIYNSMERKIKPKY